MHILSGHFGRHMRIIRKQNGYEENQKHIKTDITCIVFKRKIIFRLIDCFKAQLLKSYRAHSVYRQTLFMSSL